MGQLHLRGIAWQTLGTGEKKKEMRLFFYDLTPTGEWKHGWLYGRIQRDRQALGQMGGQKIVY